FAAAFDPVLAALDPVPAPVFDPGLAAFDPVLAAFDPVLAGFDSVLAAFDPVLALLPPDFAGPDPVWVARPDSRRSAAARATISSPISRIRSCPRASGWTRRA
ncbi:MAG: hypothetical protein ABWY97_03490, partial [Thermoleophilaceae bacterium]